ncbi:flagellar brake protein [Rossellomorea vietnamensis]|uniref:Pilus assembly protein PilZ n=1 Tax=Rossellomorea aquimaris TaxID=189382 RepID=A0A5D4TX30_9BACI|nr:flagellar brake domain-containing protein [Rossellomorea aquimaris]TYS79264.1 pilus assembly protein PilZ [Rossellomorea aquimaris]
MLKIGTTLTLEPIQTDKAEKFRCKAVEFKDSKLYIDYPVHTETERTVFLIDGTQLKVSFVYNENTVFSFQTEVTGRKKSNIPMICLHYPGDGELVKVQRRQFVRVETSVDAAVITPSASYTTITTDLSAGGCAVKVHKDHRYEAGMEVEIILVLLMQTGEYHYFNVPGKVVRVWDKGSGRIASLEFNELKDNQQQDILRFCFERQLSLRNKGLVEY